MARTVRDMMMLNPLTVDAGTTIEDAARLMREHDITDVLVTDAGRLHGLLTERDIVFRAIAGETHPADTSAGECCRRDVPAVVVDDELERAADVMHQHGLKRLPVLDEGRLVGIVWGADIAALVDGRRRTPADISIAPRTN
jgi:CBS domain-containing protein